MIAELKRKRSISITVYRHHIRTEMNPHCNNKQQGILGGKAVSYADKKYISTINYSKNNNNQPTESNAQLA